jgi:hypothetical protein
MHNDYVYRHLVHERQRELRAEADREATARLMRRERVSRTAALLGALRRRLQAPAGRPALRPRV